MPLIPSNPDPFPEEGFYVLHKNIDILFQKRISCTLWKHDFHVLCENRHPVLEKTSDFKYHCSKEKSWNPIPCVVASTNIANVGDYPCPLRRLHPINFILSHIALLLGYTIQISYHSCPALLLKCLFADEVFTISSDFNSIVMEFRGQLCPWYQGFIGGWKLEGDFNLFF